MLAAGVVAPPQINAWIEIRRDRLVAESSSRSPSLAARAASAFLRKPYRWHLAFCGIPAAGSDRPVSTSGAFVVTYHPPPGAGHMSTSSSPLMVLTRRAAFALFLVFRH